MSTSDDQSPVEVYRANDAIHAHVLKAELEWQGIRAFVVGDILDTATRRYLWKSAAKIVVSKLDATRAREIIQGLESQAGHPVDDDPGPVSCLSDGPPSHAVGVRILAIATIVFGALWVVGPKLLLPVTNPPTDYTGVYAAGFVALAVGWLLLIAR